MSFQKISPEQCRGARAMLGWSQAALAQTANLGKQTLVDFERGARVPHANNLAAIQRALEAAGVEFLPNNGLRLNAVVKSSTASRSSGPKRQTVAADQDAETGPSKPTRSGKPAPRAKPASMSKYAQIRALRE